VLLVATARDVDAQQDGERARLLAAIARAGQRLPLAGWSTGELARFVTAACGTAPSETLVTALHRATDGNPFFVDEIVRLLVAEGRGALPSEPTLRIPASVRAAIRERLGPLAGSTRRVLAAAAVAGRDFDLAVVREACEVDSAATLDALGEAERAALIVRHPEAFGQYGFVHGLVPETLYEDLLPAECAQWHRRVGEALERVHAADLGPHLEQLAHHFAHAAAAGDVDKAIDYDMRAARHAADQLAFEAAARHYQRALRVQELRGPIDEGVRLDLRLGLGDMQAAAWDIDAARDTFRAAAHSARHLLRADALARAALGFAGVGFGLPRGTVDAEIVALLEETLRLFGERRSALWARVAVRLAVELHFSAAESERCDTLSRQAVEAARRIGDDATLAYVLNARHFAAWSTADPEERLALADEAVRLAQNLGDQDLNLQGRTWRLLDLAETGDGIGFDRELEPYERLVEHRRLPKYLGFALALRGLRALWLGRFDEAVARAEAAMVLGERVGDRAAFASVATQIFFARRAQGRLAELEPVARATAELSPANPAPRCLLALLYADLEREADARREYARLAGDDFAALQSRNILHPLAYVLAEVCVYLGDRGRAGVLYRSLRPFAGRVMGLGPNVLFGPAAHPLATLAALLDQWDDAVQHFEAAIAEAGRMQGPVWLAAIQFDYARCLLARGDAQRAGELAGAALAHARAHGMPTLAARAGALQAHCDAAAQPQRVRQTARTAAGARAGRPSKDAGGRVLRFPRKP
jgi:tetratricopeptide (TPR) repeat protein